MDFWGSIHCCVAPAREAAPELVVEDVHGGLWCDEEMPVIDVAEKGVICEPMAMLLGHNSADRANKMNHPQPLSRLSEGVVLPMGGKRALRGLSDASTAVPEDASPNDGGAMLAESADAGGDGMSPSGLQSPAGYAASSVGTEAFTPCSGRTTPGQRRRRRMMMLRARESGSRASLVSIRDSIAMTVTQALNRIGLHSEPQQPIATRTETMEELFAGLPAPAVPARNPSLTQVLEDFTIADIRRLVENSGNGIFENFYKQSTNAHSMRCTEWGSFTPEPDVEARRMSMRYIMPVPKDVPDIAKKFVKIPAEIKGTTVCWFRCDDNQEMVFHQRCLSEGIMFSDRFHVEFTYEFTALPDGSGVRLRQWVETSWNKPLPWSQGFLTRMLENKVSKDSGSNAPKLLKMMKEMRARMMEEAVDEGVASA